MEELEEKNGNKIGLFAKKTFARSVQKVTKMSFHSCAFCAHGTNLDDSGESGALCMCRTFKVVISSAIRMQ